MKRGAKYSILFGIITGGVFGMYMIFFPSEMAWWKYLIMSGVIGGIFGGFIIYGNKIER